MTSITFPRKEFEKSIKLTKGVEEKISLFGTPLESINNKEIEIEVFPNRPDLLSMQGFLRGFKAFLGKEPGLRKYKINKSENKLYAEKSLPKEWPYAIACIIKGLKFDDEKIKGVVEIQEKLGATLLRNRKKGGIGLYPLEKIKFPVKFAGMNPEKIKFIPLEESHEMTGRQILKRHPTGKAYAHICQDWDKFPVFIDANGTIMSMPPIINSHNVGKINDTTKEVFLEATGTDLKVLRKALIIIASALADMGGKIHSIECIQQNNEKANVPDLTPEKIHISLENANKLLGLELKESDLSKLLPKMGYEYKNGTVKIPAWRTDILHEVDIIEDIAIAYGYNNFKPEIPNVSTIASESQQSKLRSKLSEILIGLSLTEISTYHLIKPNELSKNENKIEVQDSKTDYKYLRPNLLIPALRIFAENKDHEYPQEIFEIGTVFSKGDTETGIEEKTNLIILSSPANFTKMKQLLNSLTSSLGIKYELEETTHPQLIDGRTAKIIINNKNPKLEDNFAPPNPGGGAGDGGGKLRNGKEIGYLGELHPETLRNWIIKMPIGVIEIELDEIFDTLEQ